MRTRTLLALSLSSVMALSGCHGDGAAPDAGEPAADAPPAWLSDSKIVVPGVGLTTTDCRTTICPHNENTDLTTFQAAIFFVHRTAMSQVLGPNSALHLYRSDDGARTFTPLAIVPAPAAGSALGGTMGRDLRDPHFFTVGTRLFVKALTRLPVTSERDSDVDTIAIEIHSDDGGRTWSDPNPIGPVGYSFWRVQSHEGVLYSAAYHDGDSSVTLFTSQDGLAWTMGPLVYGESARTPVETELTFMPSGRLLALVRTDGDDAQLLGDPAAGLETEVCWAEPPYATFDCPQALMGERLDGPLSFLWQGRLFEIARKHLPALKKRTALFELGGTLDGGPLTIREWGELPSAGDTSYAGIAFLDDHRATVTWYSGDLADDESWIFGMLHATDIRQATIDLSLVK